MNAEKFNYLVAVVYARDYGAITTFEAAYLLRRRGVPFDDALAVLA